MSIETRFHKECVLGTPVTIESKRIRMLFQATLDFPWNLERLDSFGEETEKEASQIMNPDCVPKLGC